jgi:hypothetical protein
MSVRDQLFVRPVAVTFPQAVQAIAACEDRIRHFQDLADRGADVTEAIRDSHAFVAILRETFGLWPMTERELEEAHEAAVAAVDRMTAPADVPQALDAYWNHS